MLITNVLNVDISIDCLMILAKNSRLRERKHNKLYSKMMQKSEICIFKIRYILYYAPPISASGGSPVCHRASRCHTRTREAPLSHLSGISVATLRPRSGASATLVRR